MGLPFLNPGIVYKPVDTESEKSSYIGSDQDTASLTRCESISDEKEANYEAAWKTKPQNAVPWFLMVATFVFAMSLALNLLIRSRVSSTCVSIMEPWSKFTQYLIFVNNFLHSNSPRSNDTFGGRRMATIRLGILS
jgi:hypothetical protein